MQEGIRERIEQDVARIAGGLVLALDEPAALDQYTAALAAALRADYAAVMVADSTGSMRTVALWTSAPASAEVGATGRLTAAEVDAMAAGDCGALQRTERVLGIAQEWHRHWFALVVDGRDVGKQVVARAADSFTASEQRAIEQLAAVLSRALERRQTAAQLQRADGIKSEFVRTVSHELRTPLNTVIGYADLLAEEVFGPLDDEQRRVLRRVGDRARGLLEVIAATLDLPGVDGGRLSLATRPISVSQLLTELEADAREWRVRHDLEYVWDVADDLPVMTTDPGKLRVLLKNLIANAVKFTDRGSIAVRARAHDDGVEFTVEDTGIGIEPDAVHFVFDAFRQANAAATGQCGGVGLGLYIVRRLVGMLGGRLRVESEVGVGSKFHVWMPASLDRRCQGR